MKLYKVSLTLFLLLSTSVFSQKYELGKVSIAELQEKQHPIDTSAVAAILFEIGKTYFEDATTITKVTTRIKIYKKEGYEWANTEVPYFLGENVYFSDAFTYNLVDGKIEKTKLKSNGEFDEKINKYRSRKKIAMPNIKEGSIIEYEYQSRTPGYNTPRDWYFQTNIPVNYSEYNFLIPNALVFNKQIKGYYFPKISTEGKYNDDTLTKYILKNIPAMNEEPFVNNINNYKASVSFELAMINIPGRFYKEYTTNWEAVTEKIYLNDDFGGELKKIGYFEEDINTLISGITTRDEKIAAIFSFVKSKVKWNNFTSYYCNDGVKKAYKDNIGNVAEINLMLTAMLRYAGVDANPVLLSTRSNGIAFFPNRTAFNYVISAIEIEDGLILLDATEPYSTPNILPTRDLNWFGRLIRKDGTSTEVNLTPTNLSTEINNLQVTLDDKGGINGKIRTQFNGHNALNFRQENINIDKETYLEKLEDKNDALEISDYIRDNELDLFKPLVETYSFKDTNAFEVINDKLYISPLFFLSVNENPFKQEKREYPVDFGFPFEKSYNINIEIPEGYKVETLPFQSKFITEEDIGAFKYLIEDSGNKIQLRITYSINAAIVSSEFYPTLKDFFQKMIDKQNEKIVLKKL
ncbi:MAG: DUF3857 domain-containing protein [Flavobacterium sp.]|uniref:DUF3857 domain-containing protein n=1 Tax=Flavobacterium sp. TaxID=239 RepID=UPI0022C9F694|nr:DUF3857 domain-containing protein [Flavobacterium sp.]MCZ8198430.1 DUF3857 domain-containing protein [Flavobacterium sp.]